jgi:hypothetical protein
MRYASRLAESKEPGDIIWPDGQLLLFPQKEVTKSRCTGCRSFDTNIGCGKKVREIKTRSGGGILLVDGERVICPRRVLDAMNCTSTGSRTPPGISVASAQEHHHKTEGHS